MKINAQLLDLADVYKNLTHAQTWSLINDLKIFKEDLEEMKLALINMLGMEGVVNDLYELTEQLSCLRKNINTLEIALLAHESKIFERSPQLVDLQMIGLN